MRPAGELVLVREQLLQLQAAQRAVPLVPGQVPLGRPAGQPGQVQGRVLPPQAALQAAQLALALAPLGQLAVPQGPGLAPD